MIENCTYPDFKKLELRIAVVEAASYVAGADKLLELTLDVGELGKRTVLSGIRQWYEPDQLVGRQVVYLANLEPKTIRGIESQGMILATEGPDIVALLTPSQGVQPGTLVL